MVLREVMRWKEKLWPLGGDGGCWMESSRGRRSLWDEWRRLWKPWVLVSPEAFMYQRGKNWTGGGEALFITRQGTWQLSYSTPAFQLFVGTILLKLMCYFYLCPEAEASSTLPPSTFCMLILTNYNRKKCTALVITGQHYNQSWLCFKVNIRESYNLCYLDNSCISFIWGILIYF